MVPEGFKINFFLHEGLAPSIKKGYFYVCPFKRVSAKKSCLIFIVKIKISSMTWFLPTPGGERRNFFAWKLNYNLPNSTRIWGINPLFSWKNIWVEESKNVWKKVKCVAERKEREEKLLSLTLFLLSSSLFTFLRAVFNGKASSIGQFHEYWVLCSAHKEA